MKLKQDPLEDEKSLVELIDRMGDDASVVRAARVSFSQDSDGAFSDGDAKLIRYLARHGHSSPFEHCVVTLHVICPMFVRGQWMRHRTQSFNEVSRRYTSEDIAFYNPRILRSQSKNNRQASGDNLYGDAAQLGRGIIRASNKQALQTYEELLELGVAREQARMVLPQSLYTRFYTTANLWNVARFVSLRDHEDAQWEIRQYAKAVGDILSEIYPVSWQALIGEEGE